MKEIPIKIITKKEAMGLGFIKRPEMFAFQATGRIGEPAHQVDIIDPKTGKKETLFKNGKKFKFNNFK